jgi:hypothetical protein
MITNDQNQPRRGFPTNVLPGVFWEMSMPLPALLEVMTWTIVIQSERVRHG